jgi:hypothetical protein
MNERRLWKHNLKQYEKPETKKTLISKIKQSWQKNQLKK